MCESGGGTIAIIDLSTLREWRRERIERGEVWRKIDFDSIVFDSRLNGCFWWIESENPVLNQSTLIGHWLRVNGCIDEIRYGRVQSLLIPSAWMFAKSTTTKFVSNSLLRRPLTK